MDFKLINPKEHKQLFLDDHVIESMKGIKKSLHQPQKWGSVIKSGYQSRISPQWNAEKKIWEWWFMGENIHYTTSTDGEHWEKPSLGLYEWNGSKDNNIVCDPEGDGHQRPFHIIRDQSDPDPTRRYKGLFSSSERYAGISNDGFNWTMLDTPPIPSQDESQFTYDPFTKQYLAMVKQPTKWGRSVFLSTSKDFVSFTEPKLIFCSDEVDWENCRRRVREVIENPSYITPPIVDDQDYIAEVYNMAVMPYQGIYIGFPTIFNPFGAIPPPRTNFTRINQIELSVSRDLYNWERVADRALFIGLEPWDNINYGTSQLLMSGQPVVRKNGEIWIYYNSLRLPGSIEDYKTYNRSKELFRLNVDLKVFNDSGALSLAKLRPDGFVSVDGDESGIIVTKPFLMKGENLYINADARWGEIYTEIIDAATMKTHPGFWVPGEHPPPFRDDSVKAKVDWKYPHDLVFEKPVRLKFYLHQARLYSFWLE